MVDIILLIVSIIISTTFSFLFGLYIGKSNLKIQWTGLKRNKLNKLENDIIRLINEASNSFDSINMTFPDFLNNIKDIVVYGLLEDGKINMEYGEIYNYISDYIASPKNAALLDALNRKYNSISSNFDDDDIINTDNPSSPLTKLTDINPGVFDRENDQVSSPFVIGGVNQWNNQQH